MENLNKEKQIEEKAIEETFNELIKKCAENGGHVYIKDKLHNTFIYRITEPIKISVYEGYKGAQDEEK